MSVYAQCPACGEQFRRPDSLAGKLERCPECHTVFRLPAAKSHSEAKPRTAKRKAPPPPTPPAKSPTGPSPKAPVPAQKPPPPTPPAKGPTAPSPKAPVPTQKSPPPTPPPRVRLFPLLRRQFLHRNRRRQRHRPRVRLLPVLRRQFLHRNRRRQRHRPRVRLFPVLRRQFLHRNRRRQRHRPRVRLLPVLRRQFPAQKSPRSPAPTVKSSTGTVSEPQGPRQPGSVASRESAKAVDYVAVAAGGTLEGQSPGAIEAQLVQQGMDPAEARRMVQFMSAACQQHQEEQKKKRITVWARMLVGLTLSSSSIWAPSWPLTLPITHKYGSTRRRGLCGSRRDSFLRGLWRVVVGPRRLRAEDLSAAWEEQKG